MQSTKPQFNKLNYSKLSSVEPNKLWDALQLAIDQSKNEKLEKINITEVIESWVNSEFYPIINVTRNYTSGQIKVSQLSAGTAFGLSESDSSKWWIPLSFAKSSDLNFNATLPSHWLKPSTDELIIEGIDAEEWVVFNIQQTGKNMWYRHNDHFFKFKQTQ